MGEYYKNQKTPYPFRLSLYNLWKYSSLFPLSTFRKVNTCCNGIFFCYCCFGILSMTYWIQNIERYINSGGSILFILSDSMLALNQFYFEKDFFGPWVMVTYIGAQGFITFFKNEALASNS